MGNQQRSAKSSALAVKEINEGIIGDVFKGEAYYSNNRDSIGTGKKIQVPSTLDWEMWQGQAATEDYREKRCHYQFRWWYEYSGGKFTDWGAHHVDIASWALKSYAEQKLPRAGLSKAMLSRRRAAGYLGSPQCVC